MGSIRLYLFGRGIIASLFFGLFVFFFVHLGSAVPADPAPHMGVMIDGSHVEYVMVGDEYASYFETIDGYTLVKADVGGELKFAYAYVGADGTLKASNESRKSSFAKHVRPVMEKVKVIGHERTGVSSMVMNKSPVSYFPAKVTGSDSLAVVMMDFSDVSADAAHSASYFDDLLFGSGGSVRNLDAYLDEVSYGQFGVGGVVSGWYTADFNHGYYGSDSGSYTDGGISSLIEEAVWKADEAVDFSLYDDNGDGVVDNFLVIYSGRPQSSSGISTDIWPHSSAIPYPGVWADGVLIRSYFVVSEYSMMGTFAHEFMHSIGLPDLYDSDSGYDNPVYYWDLMSMGAYLGGGHTPAHIGGYLKYDLDGDPSNGYRGWLVPNVISYVPDDGHSLSLNNFESMSGTRLYRVNSVNPGEYFLVENRQAVGYDVYLPDSGLVIWHIDEDMPDNPGSYTINDGLPYNSYYRAWVENPGGSSDVYKRNAAYSLGDGQTVFDVGSSPASDLNGGDVGSSGVSISNIGTSGDVMSFDVDFFEPFDHGYVLESKHPYMDNRDYVMSVQRDGASRIRIHFNRTELEDGFDNLELLDGSSALIASYTGSSDDFWSPWVGGDVITLRFVSDEYVHAYGFSVDDVEAEFPINRVSINYSAGAGLGVGVGVCRNVPVDFVVESESNLSEADAVYVWLVNGSVVSAAGNFSLNTSDMSQGLYNVSVFVSNSVSDVSDSVVLQIFPAGDVNHDDVVDSVDALMALQMSVGNIGSSVCADVNFDGVVTSLDALMILHVSVGNIVL